MVLKDTDKEVHYQCNALGDTFLPNKNSEVRVCAILQLYYLARNLAMIGPRYTISKP